MVFISGLQWVDRPTGPWRWAANSKHRPGQTFINRRSGYPRWVNVLPTGSWNPVFVDSGYCCRNHFTGWLFVRAYPLREYFTIDSKHNISTKCHKRKLITAIDIVLFVFVFTADYFEWKNCFVVKFLLEEHDLVRRNKLDPPQSFTPIFDFVLMFVILVVCR